jgi:hypothetical protein
MHEVDFLDRIFDLDKLPSDDYRFASARGDIKQHRILNDDWSDDWIWSDDRLKLLEGTDETFLLFLGQTLSPLVRGSIEEAAYLTEQINEVLRPEGWQFTQTSHLAGRVEYTARRVDSGTGVVDTARDVGRNLGEYVDRQVARMEAAIDTDPDLAIGTSKEFLETVCKTILRERSMDFDLRGDDLPRLVKLTARNLELIPADVQVRAAATETIRILLNNLTSVADRIAEIRNLAGTGHGRDAEFQGLGSRHARLAVHAAVALGVFLYETHAAQRPC